MKKVKKMALGGIGRLMNKSAVTAQTAKQGNLPPTVLPAGINPNFKSAMGSLPKYAGPGFGPAGNAASSSKPMPIMGRPMNTGAGFGPTAPANMGKINQIASMIKGRPMKEGGKVSSASKRADGCAVKGKTKGKIV